MSTMNVRDTLFPDEPALAEIVRRLVEAYEPERIYHRFHAQQATRKVLKAFLAWHDVPFRKTHNIEALGRTCVEIDATLRSVFDPAVPLAAYAWKFRYPGQVAQPGPGEAARALDLVRDVYRAVLERLRGLVRP